MKWAIIVLDSQTAFISAVIAAMQLSITSNHTFNKAADQVLEVVSSANWNIPLVFTYIYMF